MVWPVPVVTLVDTRRQQLVYRVTETGDLVLQLPAGVREVVIPPTSDDEMCDSFHQARAVANAMGTGL